MFDSEYREVDFATYCPKCVYEKKKENEDPCCRCLVIPISLYSTKPVRFEAKKNGK